jgi:uncharacterized glyoxalase superfamily protein PhnB
MAASAPKVATEIIPYIFYRDVPAALDFLARAFGFTELMRTGTPSGGMHAEMAFDGQRIMMGQASREAGMASVVETEVATQGVFVYLADVDAHYERARAAGARIAKPPQDLPYGRSYTAHDLDGHPWFFTTPPAES